VRRVRGGAALGVGLLLAAAPVSAARVVNVRVGVDGDRTRVVFELDAPAGHQSGAVQPTAGGGELVVKIDAGSGLRIVPAKSELVRSVRVQPEGAGALARIALRSQHVRVSEMTLGGPPRLVFDLRPAEGAVAAAPPHAAAPSAARLAPAPGPRVAVATPPPTPQAARAPRVAAADPPSDFERNVERQLNERVGLPAPPPRPAEAPAPAESAPPAPAAGEPGVTPEATAPSGEAAPAAPAEAAPAGEPAPAEAAPAAEEAKPAPPPAPPAEAPAPGPPSRPPLRSPASGLDVQIVLLAVAALLLLFLVWRRLGRRAATAARERIVPPHFTEVLEEPTETLEVPSEAPPPLPLFEAAAPPEPAAEAPAPVAVPSAPLGPGFGEREAAPLLGGDLDAVVVDEGVSAAAWAEAPAPAAAPTPGGEPEVARLVRELERRIAHLETRLEEAADARERLERHMAAQTEELRVQRAAIARTQRVLRSLARPEDLATEPVPRDPGRGGPGS